MSEDRTELSVEEILEDLRKRNSEKEDEAPALSESESEAEMLDEETGASETVFGEYDDDEAEEETIPQDAEEAEETEETAGTGETDDESQVDAQEDEQSLNAADVKNPDVPSFKKLFEEKKLEKSREGQTKVFSKNDTKPTAANDKTRHADNEIPVEGEDEMEKQFNESRQEKIGKFRLFTEGMHESVIGENEAPESSNVFENMDISAGEDIFTAVEKATKPKKENTKHRELIKKRNSKVYDKIDVGRVKLRLKNERDSQKTRAIILAVCFAVTFVWTILKTVYTAGKLPGLDTVMNEKCAIFYAVTLALSIVPLATAVTDFVYRLKNSEKFEFTNELYLVVVGAINVFHCVVMLTTRQPVDKSTMTFSLAVIFVNLLSTLAQMKENSMIMANLNTLTQNEKILGVYPLTKDAEKLAGGISSSKEPNILCASEVELPNSFMDSSTFKDKQNAYLKVIIPLMLAFGVAVGALAAFTYGGILPFSLGLTSTVILCCPAYLTTVLATLISFVNRRLNIAGCEILGYEAVEFVDDTDAIVLDASDIFYGEMSNFHVINHRAGVDNIDAFRAAAALIIESGGVLAGRVQAIVDDEKLILPKVEQAEYEERLGISGWMNNNRVLLGTRQMMINHNMEVPPEYFETPYIQEGKKIFYFAVNTQVVAMFCATYKMTRLIYDQLRKLHHTGLILMIMTADPDIDEEYVAATIGADPNCVKIVNSTGTQTIRKEIDKTANQKRTGLIFRRNISGLLKVINTAFELYDSQHFTLLIQTVSIVSAFILTLVLNIVATKYFIGEWLIIGYHAIWSVIALIVTSRK